MILILNVIVDGCYDWTLAVRMVQASTTGDLGTWICFSLLEDSVEEKPETLGVTKNYDDSAEANAACDCHGKGFDTAIET